MKISNTLQWYNFVWDNTGLWQVNGSDCYSMLCKVRMYKHFLRDTSLCDLSDFVNINDIL